VRTARGRCVPRSSCGGRHSGRPPSGSKAAAAAPVAASSGFERRLLVAALRAHDLAGQHHEPLSHQGLVAAIAEEAFGVPLASLEGDVFGRLPQACVTEQQRLVCTCAH